MSCETIKSYFTDAVNLVASDIPQFAVNPDKDFTRSKKLNADKLLSLRALKKSDSYQKELGFF